MSRRKPYEIEHVPEGAPVMWRSLEEKYEDPEARRKRAEAEHVGGFMQGLIASKATVSRRGFLQITGVAAAAVGAAGCIRRPVDNILPYARAPEQIIPGIPLHFATVTQRGGDALGLLVTSHDGRPTKVEGNPIAGFGGATDVRAQMLVWDLYDPHRSKRPARSNGGKLVDASYDEVDTLLSKTAAGLGDGAGLRILTRSTNSPSELRLRKAIQKRFPKSRLYVYESVNDDNALEGMRIASGRPLAAIVDFSRAKVVLSLDADFLGTETSSVRAGHSFGRTRAIESPDGPISRLYMVEPGHSITGAMADNRLRLPGSQIGPYLRALAAALAEQGVSVPAGYAGTKAVPGVSDKWVTEVARDLAAHRGASVITAGRNQPPAVHALVAALNAALGNELRTVFYAGSTQGDDGDLKPSVASLRAFADEIDGASTVLILGCNPIYDAPADVDVGKVLAREGLTSIHLASHRDATSERCSWHIPLANELETWGDQRAFDGRVAVQQPLIAPLFGAKSAIEVLAVFADEPTASGHDIVRRTLDLPDARWRSSLHSGQVNGTLLTLLARAPVDEGAVAKAVASLEPAAPPSKDNLEVAFVPDPALWDGRHANNVWGLELPDPMTKIVWDNAALISYKTRNALGLKNGQRVRLTRAGKTVEIPVWAVPGHADWCVTLNLGWGRKDCGRYGDGTVGGGGFDVQPLRTSDAFYTATGVKIETLPTLYNLVQTQTHDTMEGRPIVIDATLDEYKKQPDFASYRSVVPTNGPLWQEVDYSKGHQWGMVFDLSACSGCSACVIACQAENNVPTVGKDEVDRGREMFWIRLDRYFVGDDEDPGVSLQPMACQQCEEAPCENVCPVNATTHSPEGLNDMAYNRCVGTRYCANNCPYKVRRFNYYDWQAFLDDKWKMYGEAIPETRKMQYNPNVTVRMRGVMEKCTYCVQRIQEAKIGALREHRPLKDGDIVTACQAACPTQAITFGDLNDKDARVTKLAMRDRRYKVMPHLGTQPRTTFLGRIRNPNPALGQHSAPHGEEAHG
ncbi:MAG: TAT-variant-translocated molybdopterin oxidoreductase [Myxococcales bacterium]|nr:TAT-variant-translocated molybdopterin oxidoreductase [Myxococcales bacterium]